MPPESAREVSRDIAALDEAFGGLSAHDRKIVLSIIARIAAIERDEGPQAAHRALSEVELALLERRLGP